MASIKLEVVAETADDLDQVLRDLLERRVGSHAATVRAGVGQQEPRESRDEWDTPAIRQAIESLSDLGKQFLRRLGHEAIHGRRLCSTPELYQEFGVTSGIAFAGIRSGITKTTRTVVPRPLVTGHWVTDHACWSMESAAAEVVLQILGER